MCIKTGNLILQFIPVIFLTIVIDNMAKQCYSIIVNIAGWSSLVARRAHNPKVVGSNPAPATKKNAQVIRPGNLFISFSNKVTSFQAHLLPKYPYVILKLLIQTGLMQASFHVLLHPLQTKFYSHNKIC